ncbi:nuclear transport factor 2 family protein [Leucobacter coleopterorum]|uniref:Nuclear transport factor 2 family protein n=1 Tax=Leucobacter coleopterorum TaxID=2714933 RepID=A0ABX6JZZ6_9MICO|nr:nuclear transport factor 2 family protein [Leucobacter coleopterorum]QIM18375.1 nuclear transport factor 2 family protein [Leucobacter coleopterorum]
MSPQSAPITVVTDYFTALAEGRVPDALAKLHPQVQWHQPGQNQFSGVHTGPDAVSTLIGGMMGVSGGTFALAPAGPLMANGALVAAPVHFTGSRNDGVQLDQLGLDLLTVHDGLIVEVHLFSADGPAEDAFWGSSATQ